MTDQQEPSVAFDAAIRILATFSTRDIRRAIKALTAELQRRELEAWDDIPRRGGDG